MTKLLVVSDSHLSAGAAEADGNWDAIVDSLDGSEIAAVLHAGDISMNGAGDEHDLRHARARLDDLPRPWRAVPGNHDIGDIGETAEPIDAERRDRYERLFGERFWTLAVDRWRVVGIDCQSLLSDVDGVDHWWRWLERALDHHGPVAVVQHRPLGPIDEGEHDLPRRYVSGPDRARLSRLYRRARVALVVSGHVHQWRSASHRGLRQVWAPSTWTVIPDRAQPVIGAKVIGAVELDLGDDGAQVRLRPLSE